MYICKINVKIKHINSRFIRKLNIQKSAEIAQQSKAISCCVKLQCKQSQRLNAALNAKGLALTAIVASLTIYPLVSNTNNTHLHSQGMCDTPIK